MEDLSENYWDQRYKNQNMGWDLGTVSPPLKAFIDQLEDTSLRILIPGAGNAYEAEYLWAKGFNQVFVVDLSETALERFKKRVPAFPSNQLLQQNFFDLEDQFDLILEQTFFCALHPNLRNDYAKKMLQLLAPKGKLVGLLFDAELYVDHPPFGGHKNDYLELFSPLFHIDLMSACYNSEENRKGQELFIALRKRI
ncbi:methyltransferase domain-containing protein [Subsaximicrobium wynnwilliamsii]|uniref:Methyltransferase domain-containing protein n=1 Tax=Subsaximicrobium wynnwilliamsii TaxID=291179 RepID=A0A5C6ZCX7_9FLAO|nr:methyltransferase domain-containing protein [Subsaximicrobium wynnwilliamsii]TXD81958.1 methyltransferase domain-containing protein [Subsaximicrobium wynnwilliamsii]TXD87656.1 methyltransferase domain-containing protein [Subsaximicrobium wynnwilliamsii]TXE01403.1 methyltransferase domain-containing protein [Subsaximicrobium wynnwilliamsii]